MTVSITAQNLREYFNADPKRLAALDKADPTGRARKTVEQVEGKFPRGQVSPVAIALNNKRRPKAQYVRGGSGVAKAAAQVEAARVRKAAADAGITVGKRGPLPKAALALVAKPKGRSRKG